MTIQVKSKREYLQAETYSEVVSLLKGHKKCAVIRPTGWGKTHLFSSLVKNYKKVLYLYPTKSVLKMVSTTLSKGNITIGSKKSGGDGRVIPMTFARLSRLTDIEVDKIKSVDFDLVVIDELHRGGAEKVSEVLTTLIPYWVSTGTHVIGGTATPLRSDGYDVVKEFFDDIVCSKYTLQDAISDGLLPLPIYSFSVFNKDSLLEPIKTALKGVSKEARKTYSEKLKSLEYTVAVKLNASQVIKKAVNLAHDNPTYLKFIVFLPNKFVLKEEKEKVVAYFTEAFPHLHDIKTLTIHSDKEFRSNVNDLENLTPTDGRIDLIFAINMLNEGYHIDSLTGVVMLRRTHSLIINTQQIGRAFNVMSDKRPIIIDLVDNFNTPYLFSSLRGNQNSKLEKGVLSDYELSREKVTLVDNVTSTFKLLDKLCSEITEDVEQQICQLWYSYCQHLPSNQIKHLIKAQGGGINSHQVKEILISYGLITESQSQLL